MTAVVSAYRCGAVPDLHRVPSSCLQVRWRQPATITKLSGLLEMVKDTRWTSNTPTFADAFWRSFPVQRGGTLILGHASLEEILLLREIDRFAHPRERVR
jgi:hypothetical protein